MSSKVLTAQEGPSGKNGAEEPEEGRMSRRAWSRQKVTRVLLTKGVSRTWVAQKSVEQPDTLLGTASSSQDGNEWSGRHRAARSPSSRISSRQTTGEHRLARGYQMAGAAEEPMGSHIIVFLTPDSGQNLLEWNIFGSQTCFRAKPFLQRKPAYSPITPF